MEGSREDAERRDASFSVVSRSSSITQCPVPISQTRNSAYSRILPDYSRIIPGFHSRLLFPKLFRHNRRMPSWWMKVTTTVCMYIAYMVCYICECVVQCIIHYTRSVLYMLYTWLYELLYVLHTCTIYYVYTIVEV